MLRKKSPGFGQTRTSPGLPILRPPPSVPRSAPETLVGTSLGGPAPSSSPSAPLIPGSAARFRVTDLHSTRCQERTKPRFAILEAPSSDETFRKKLGLGLQVERKT